MQTPAEYIGGFMELEINAAPGACSFHPDALAFHSGRACFNYIIQEISPSKFYVPYYCCNALIEPLLLNNVKYEFYSIDADFMLSDNIVLKQDEYIVYVNYFGLCSNNVEKMYSKFGKKLILDNTQCFFEKRYKDCYSFNSARKFFGVPDGAYLYSAGSSDRYTDIPYNKHITLEHLVLRLIGEQAMAYEKYQINEKDITCALKKMSMVSERILNSLNYPEIIAKRQVNYNYYHTGLGEFNSLNFNYSQQDIPYCYPFLPKAKVDKLSFHGVGIFIPTFWTDVFRENSGTFGYEKKISEYLLPLPVDHRYNKDHCYKLIDTLLPFIE